MHLWFLKSSFSILPFYLETCQLSLIGRMDKLTLITLLAYVNIISSCRYPHWPNEFRWSSAGPIDGWTCKRILETADPNTWHDNYFCHYLVPGIQGVGLVWSSAGKQRTMLTR